MTVQQLLTMVLTAASIVLCGLAAWAITAIVRAVRAVERLASETGDRLPALLDEARASIARVDTIVDRVDEVTERMGSATRVAETAVGSRIATFAALFDRVRRSVARARRG